MLDMQDVDHVIKHHDIEGDWELHVTYCFKLVVAPDFVGWIYKGHEMEVYLNGSLVLELDPDDAENFDYLAIRDRPEL